MDILHGELRGRMNSEQKLWELKAGGFEGVEQARINLARGVGGGGRQQGRECHKGDRLFNCWSIRNEIV